MFINDIIIEAEKELYDEFKVIESVALINQSKVLNAFKENKISSSHFNGTTGYGEGDTGRNKLSSLFSSIFNTEKALVSPHILCGTHALTISLYGLLNSGDKLLSIAGEPYDTLKKVITGKGVGSLEEIGVRYNYINLLNGVMDIKAILKQVEELKPKVVYLQRSKGYSFRREINISEMEVLFKKIKTISPLSIILVDNCYGEFTEIKEPTDVGADIIVGSLTKNPGGGIVPNGGYIAGKEIFINKISYKLTSPSLGAEVGSYEPGYRLFYEGIYMAPQLVMQAIKGKCLARRVFEKLNYEVLPTKNSIMSDIVLAIKVNNSKKLINLCQSIQESSPIDSFVVLEPWNMSGYQDKVIMAAGTFVEGATGELSCDAPMREPFIAYLQGGLSYNHCKIALNNYLNETKKDLL